MIAVVGVLLSVAFFTLIERKIIGLIHYRKGPRKVFLFGVSQPMADAMKLLTKERIKIMNTKITIFLLGPAVRLTLMLLI